MLIARVAFVVTVVFGVAALPARADATGVTPTAALDCADPIGAVAPPRSEVVGGQVALVTSNSRHQAAQAVPDGNAAMERYRFFAKSPLYVRTGTGSAHVVVPRSERGLVAVSWGNTDHDGTASRVFDVGPCAGTGTWINFPGGYFVSEPRCVKLVVRTKGKHETVRVGVGKACPGQRPPPPTP